MNNNKDRLHILLVDDEHFLVKLWKNVLEKHGYAVKGYTSARLALKDFENNPNSFDIVVTDQSMPDMTGKEFAVELIKIRSDIKIIICTGYLGDVDIYKGIGIESCEYLLKPFDNSTLINAIEKNI
jgi:DNA-binding response OmpR family regulator